MSYNNRNNQDFWFDNRYGPRGQNRENFHPQDDFQNLGNQNNNQNSWDQNDRQQDWHRRDYESFAGNGERFPDNRDRFNRNQGNNDRGGSYDYSYRRDWQQDSSPYHSSYGDSRHGNNSGYNSGRFGMPNSFNHHDNNLYGTKYGPGGSNWGYSGAAPGGLGSAGPLSGDGTVGVSPNYGSGPNGAHGLGYSSMGGMMHRNTAGMNYLGSNNFNDDFGGDNNQGNNW